MIGRSATAGGSFRCTITGTGRILARFLPNHVNRPNCSQSYVPHRPLIQLASRKIQVSSTSRKNAGWSGSIPRRRSEITEIMEAPVSRPGMGILPCYVCIAGNVLLLQPSPGPRERRQRSQVCDRRRLNPTRHCRVIPNTIFAYDSGRHLIYIDYGSSDSYLACTAR